MIGFPCWDDWHAHFPVQLAGLARWDAGWQLGSYWGNGAWLVTALENCEKCVVLCVLGMSHVQACGCIISAGNIWRREGGEGGEGGREGGREGG